MAEVELKWELESRNFDELKSELDESIQKSIGGNHCKLCVLASGPMCIHREVCRIPQNEVWINKEVSSGKVREADLVELKDVCMFMEDQCLGRGLKKFPSKRDLIGKAMAEFEGKKPEDWTLEELCDEAYWETKKELMEFFEDDDDRD